MSYQQLNGQANTLARVLVAQGLEPEEVVAVLAERSIAFVTAMLAIWKAGGAYLPLDPQHPALRLAHVLKQSAAQLVLTTSALLPTLQQALETLPAAVRPQVRLLEDVVQLDVLSPNLPQRCAPSQLAYLIYTSGSTGTPKGVMVEHRGMLNHMRAKLGDVQLKPKECIAQNGPQCFDIAAWQSVAPLLVGGRVQILPDEIALDPAQLLEEIEEQGIAVLQLVPSMLRALLTQVETAQESCPALSALRWVVPTGDALPSELCRQWLSRYPTIPVLNTYGSTECSDDQCHYAITSSTQVPDNGPPIAPLGPPITNMRAYVLDQQLEVVPMGVVGELYIGGLGVGRGYLEEAERTARVFVPDPFASQVGARMYKTGDRVRSLANGSIEFLGRVDHLVKLRGHRIEPGEIEAVLSLHPTVHESVVVVQEGERGKQLVAYVVPKETMVLSSEGFIRHEMCGIVCSMYALFDPCSRASDTSRS